MVVPESQLRPSFEMTGAAAAPSLASPPAPSAPIGEDERKSMHAPRTEPNVGEISPSPPDAAATDASAKAPSASPPPRSGGGGGVGGIASKISHWVHTALGVPEGEDDEQLRAARKQEHKSQKREE
jgi:hypothetical protein